MDGADVWISVRDRALRNQHIFQNALKVVYDNLPFKKFSWGTLGEIPDPHLKGGHFAEGKKSGRFHPSKQFLDLSLTLHSLA